MVKSTGRLERFVQYLKWQGGTEHIALDTGSCIACGDCVEFCLEDVLRIGGPNFHRHVQVVDAAACTGCGDCAAACPEGALLRRDPGNEPTW